MKKEKKKTERRRGKVSGRRKREGEAEGMGGREKDGVAID